VPCQRESLHGSLSLDEELVAERRGSGRDAELLQPSQRHVGASRSQPLAPGFGVASARLFVDRAPSTCTRTGSVSDRSARSQPICASPSPPCAAALRQADVDERQRYDGLTTEERTELVRLAAYFVREYLPQ
jgi:hypothetical protein